MNYLARAAMLTFCLTLLLSTRLVSASSEVLASTDSANCIATLSIDVFTDEHSASLGCFANDRIHKILVWCKNDITLPDGQGEVKHALFAVSPTHQPVKFAEPYTLEFRMGRNPTQTVAVSGGWEGDTADGYDAALPQALTVALHQRKRFAWRFNHGTTAILRPLEEDAAVATAFDGYCQQVRSQ